MDYRLSSRHRNIAFALRAFSRVFGFAIVLIAISTSPISAAEVGCTQRLMGDGGDIPDEIAKSRWPSGFRPVSGMCIVGYLQGIITKGDFEKIQRLLHESYRTLHWIELVSPGGDVDEAIKIGRLFRKYLFTTQAPFQNNLLPGRCEGPECICASACALIWFGGVDRMGGVGLHRPRINDPEFKDLSPAEAAPRYERALAQITRYLDEMEIPRQVASMLTATDSSRIRWMDESQTEGIERPPSYAEWEDANCPPLTLQEHQTFINLLTPRPEQSANADKELLFTLLGDKFSKHAECTGSLRSSRVDALPPP
jgi:hypothetical protein